MLPANFEYASIVDENGLITLRDLGPWDTHLTITNDAENVFNRVAADFQQVKKINYYDSENNLSELLFTDGEKNGWTPFKL